MRRLAGLVAVVLGASVLAGCGTADPDLDAVAARLAGSPTAAGGAQPIVVSSSGRAAVRAQIGDLPVDAAARAALPAAIREQGVLRVGNINAVSPPIQFGPDDDPAHLQGVEVDLRDAVARVLGLRVQSQIGTFESILPGLQSGKYDVGQGNFGVTEARKATLDFTTYYDDGFGFLGASAPGAWSPAGGTVTALVPDLCGRRIGTSAGTTFITKLQDQAAQCAARGLAPYTLSTYTDAAAYTLALQQTRLDVFVSSAISMQYAAQTRPQVLRYLGRVNAEHVGFATRRGSGLAEPLQLATAQVMSSGLYARILAAWGVSGAAIPASQVNPPGLR